MKTEIWKQIPGFEGYYSASSLGNIRADERRVRHACGGTRLVKAKPRRAHLTRHGYLQICLSKEGVDIKFSVHRLVLMAFSGESGEGMDARHLDGTRTNNVPSNLAWGTRQENMQDAIIHGTTIRGSKNPQCKLSYSDVENIRRDTRRQNQIAAEFGIDQSSVSKIKSGQRWAY